MAQSKIEQKLEEIGLRLPPSREWASPNRTGAVRLGNLLFVSGHTPPENFMDYRKYGKVGSEMSLEEARHAAEGCALAMLRSIKDHFGDLDRVVRVGKLLGFVNSASGFTQQFAVIDGASNVFHQLWGENGVHARSAVGVFELPRGQSVEVEGVFEVQ
jgi:enamine deaminase RidA (YjgF/YER057c/UK114 family)